MTLKTQMIINNDINLSRYLRENSHLYKSLNRDENSIYLIIDEMKKRYKLTTGDKLINISERIKTINEFIKILS